MENEENLQDIDLENNEEITIEEVDETEAELEELRAFKAKALKDRAIAQRLSKKGNTQTINKINDKQLEQDIAEFKFDRKVSKFAEENGISRIQAEKVLIYKPDATADDLNDEFIKAGIEAIDRKQKIANNTPSGRNSISSTPKKALTEMTKEEKEAWYKS